MQTVLGLLTIVMSGVVAAVVTSVLNSRREELRYRREWLEKLSRAFNGFAHDLGVHWIIYVPVMSGKIDYNAALDMTIKGGVSPVRHFEELKMLTTIYWPEVDDLVEELERVRSRGSEVLARHKSRYKDGMVQDRESFDAITECVKARDELVVRFQQRVRKLARNVGAH